MKKTALLILSVIILCAACAARAAGEELPGFASVRDVLDSTEDDVIIHDRSDYVVLILETGGRYIRMVTLTDDHAKDLYKIFEAEDCSAAAIQAFEDYAWALPLSYTEVLDVAPMDQAELDGLKGKTVRELMDNGFGDEMLLSESELAAPVTIDLEYGFYRYTFEVTRIASGDPRRMTIKSGKFNGFSRSAFDIDIQEIQTGPQQDGVPEN